MSKYGVTSGPFFPAFGLNTVIYSVNLCIQSNATGKYGIEINPYFDTFHTVLHCGNLSDISQPLICFPPKWWRTSHFFYHFFIQFDVGWFLDRPRIILGIDWWVVTFFQNIFMGHKFVFFLVFPDFPWHFVLFWKGTKICTKKY